MYSGTRCLPFCGSEIFKGLGIVCWFFCSQQGGERREKITVAGLYRPVLEVGWFTCAHVPLASTQSCGHFQAAEGREMESGRVARKKRARVVLSAPSLRHMPRDHGDPFFQHAKVLVPVGPSQSLFLRLL